MALDTLAAVEWPVWTTTARLVVTDGDALDDARVLIEAQLSAIELACSRFRPDSELSACAGATTRVSPLLAELVDTALRAARETGGDVDPTVGNALAYLGYDRDLSEVDSSSVPLVRRQVPGWQRIRLDGRWLTVPDGIELDLGATAKAFAADRCARLISTYLHVGVLVSIGGDIATAGDAPDGGWRIHVQDRPEDPACTVAIPVGTDWPPPAPRAAPGGTAGGGCTTFSTRARACPPIRSGAASPWPRRPASRPTPPPPRRWSAARPRRRGCAR